MGCHVYDLFYCRILTIAICDMWFEDVDSQMLMWNALVKVMKEHGVENVNFKGCMANCVRANFNAIRTLFRTSDPKLPM